MAKQKTDRELDLEILERSALSKKLALDGWRKIQQGRAAWQKDGEYLDLNGNVCDKPTEPPLPLLRVAMDKLSAMSESELRDFIEPKKKAGRPKKTESVSDAA